MDLGADDTHGTLPSPRSVFAAYDGLVFSEMDGLADAAIEIRMDEANAEVLIEASNCATPAGDQATYLARFDTTIVGEAYKGEVYLESYAPAPVYVVSDTPGPLMSAWLTERVTQAHPDPGEITRFNIVWDLDRETVAIKAYFFEPDGDLGEYSGLPEFTQPFTVIHP